MSAARGFAAATAVAITKRRERRLHGEFHRAAETAAGDGVVIHACTTQVWIFSGEVLLPHRARALRRGTLPAAIEPGLHVRPFAKIEEQGTIECAGDVQVA